MKFFLSFFFLFAGLYAQSVGNFAYPSLLQEGVIIPDTSCVNFRIGYEQGFVTNEKFTFAKRLRREDFSLQKVSATSRITSITFNVKERLDIYGNIGGINFYSLFYSQDNLYTLAMRYGNFYKVGMRLILWEVKDVSFGMQGGYCYTLTEENFLLKNAHPLNSSDMEMIMQGWDINAGISYKAGYFVPYVGVNVRNYKAKIKKTELLHKKQLRMDYRRKTGFIIGTSFTRNSYCFLNVEAHFINEISYYLSGELRF